MLKGHFDELGHLPGPGRSVFDRLRQEGHDGEHAIHVFGLSRGSEVLEVSFDALSIRYVFGAESPVPQRSMVVGEVADHQELVEPAVEVARTWFSFPRRIVQTEISGKVSLIGRVQLSKQLGQIREVKQLRPCPDWEMTAVMD